MVKRFITADGQFDDDAGFIGYNLYSYCANNPVMFVDDTGASVVLACALIGAGVGALIGAIKSKEATGEVKALWVAGGAIVGLATGAVVGWTISVIASATGLSAAGNVIGSLTPGLYQTWQQAEQALRNAYEGVKHTFHTDYGIRYVDSLSNGIAQEAKYGYQSLTSRIICEIEKDMWLLTNGYVDKVEWHFYWSNVSNTGGPSKPLLEALLNAGIEVIFH